MTIESCYRQMGGDYAQAEKRMTSGLIRKFLPRFLGDDSFSALYTAMKAGSRSDAFFAAHTLKGVSGSLCLNRLFGSVSRLTDLLRPETQEIPADAHACFEEVERDYELTVRAIRAYLDSNPAA